MNHLLGKSFLCRGTVSKISDKYLPMNLSLGVNLGGHNIPLKCCHSHLLAITKKTCFRTFQIGFIISFLFFAFGMIENLFDRKMSISLFQLELDVDSSITCACYEKALNMDTKSRNEGNVVFCLLVVYLHLRHNR